MKKYFVFSDVHGEFSALLASLDKAGFDPKNENHVLVSIGDNFDRGSGNLLVYNFLQEYQDKERFIGIIGNHDSMLFDFLRGLDDGIFNSVHNGLDRTIFELSGLLQLKKFLYDDPDTLISKIKQNNPKIIKFLSSLKDEIIIGDYILTHAGYKNINKYQNWETPIWEVDNWANTVEFIKFFPDSDQYQEDKFYVFGHWHTFRLRNQILGEEIDENKMNHNTFIHKNFIGLDACSNLSGFVNILVIEE